MDRGEADNMNADRREMTDTCLIVSGGPTDRKFAAEFVKNRKYPYVIAVDAGLAVCEELGKPDDCEELTAFRAFRDGYLRACPDGEALIREYYDIAPGIVTCINLASDRHETYREIRDTWLAPCYDDLQNGRMADCKARYTQMVRTLESRFLS